MDVEEHRVLKDEETAANVAFIRQNYSLALRTQLDQKKA
jgi:hypothetical protein